MAMSRNKEGKIVRIAEQFHPTPVRPLEERSHQYIEEKWAKAAALRGPQGVGVRNRRVTLEEDSALRPIRNPASSSNNRPPTPSPPRSRVWQKDWPSRRPFPDPGRPLGLGVSGDTRGES